MKMECKWLSSVADMQTLFPARDNHLQAVQNQMDLLFSVLHKTYFNPALASCIGNSSSHVTIKRREALIQMVHSRKTYSVELTLTLYIGVQLVMLHWGFCRVGWKYLLSIDYTSPSFLPLCLRLFPFFSLPPLLSELFILQHQDKSICRNHCTDDWVTE